MLIIHLLFPSVLISKYIYNHYTATYIHFCYVTISVWVRWFYTNALITVIDSSLIMTAKDASTIKSKIKKIEFFISFIRGALADASSLFSNVYNQWSGFPEV